MLPFRGVPVMPDSRTRRCRFSGGPAPEPEVRGVSPRRPGFGAVASGIGLRPGAGASAFPFSGGPWGSTCRTWAPRVRSRPTPSPKAVRQRRVDNLEL